MKKILIIGSSYSIKDTFSKKFNSYSITYLNFRDAWLLNKFGTYEKILVSGFHHKQINNKYLNFYEYIFDYLKFVENLKLNCNKLILVSTFIPKKISFSRVVFFYKILLDNILTKKNINFFCFKKKNHKKNKKNNI